MSLPDESIILAVTGASGSVYAERLLQEFISQKVKVHLVFSETGVKVSRYELSENKEQELSLLKFMKPSDWASQHRVKVYRNDDFFAKLASGSATPAKMIIAPCSMGTVGRIRAGLASCLIERAADVVLKEKGSLVICPRETPLHSIHLENLLALEKAGARIVPPSPGFYYRPKTLEDAVDFVVGKLVESLGMKHDLYKRWKIDESDLP